MPYYQGSSKMKKGKSFKLNNQVEHHVPPTNHIGIFHIKTEGKDKQLQETDDKTVVSSIMTEQEPHFYNKQEIENTTLKYPQNIFRQRLIYK